MTRHSPSEAALGETPVSGLHANFTLLSAFNDAVGKEVLLELVDGSVFTGIFGGASSEMEVGLYCAFEKTTENEKNLLPLKKEIVQKRQFAFSDIVCVTVPTNDEKVIRGFATDRDYHNKRRVIDDEDELEQWEGDGEDVDLENEEAVKAVKTARNGGWGVNEMFAANQSLGVKTTFEDNLSQYTTAEVEGTEEDRRRADEIARQIEKSGSSRMYSALENDDEERDLDKITDEAELLGYETKNKNAWSSGASTVPALSTSPNQNGSNGNGVVTSTSQVNGTSPRPLPLMNSTPPGFTPVCARSRKNPTSTPHDTSQNTYLSLANRGVNNNGRGGGQMVPKNNRAEGLKGDARRPSGGGPLGTAGGVPPARGPPIPSPKGTGGGQGGPGGYVKRDSYEGGQGHYDSWNKGGMKTYENTKMRDQKMMLENRNAPNSPRNTGGPGAPNPGPSATHNQKGGASARVEGLKQWQNDFTPSYRETRPMQKATQGEKMESSPPQSTPLLESAPPTKNAWQSGPPSGLTSSSSKSEESKSGAALPSPSHVVEPTPSEVKMIEERERKEDGGASTSNDGERAGEETASESKEDADVSKDSAGKKFSFNPDAPAFTPKYGPTAGGGMGGGMVVPSLPQTTMMMQNLSMAPTLVTSQGMPMQGQMGAMGGMQPVYPYTPQAQYPMQPNMQYSAVVNGGGIMAGAAQNGQGAQTGGAPSTPRGGNGAQGGGQTMGSGIRQQRPGGPAGAAAGTAAVPMSGVSGVGMYMPQGASYGVPMAQPNYMPAQPNYYAQYAQNPMMAAPQYMMNMQQQGMMGQPQRPYTQPAHPGMIMQYTVQQQYGGGPLPVNPQQTQGGVPMSSGPQGGGAASSGSNTNGGGPPSNGNGGAGQGSAPNTHPPSQPPTPGAVPPNQTGVPPQGGMMPPQGAPPGMVPAHSPAIYGMYGPPQVMYYNQTGAVMGGAEMGGEGAEGQMHQMYPYQQGQYYQSAPPHLARFPNMNQGMQQQPQHAPAQPSQSQN